MLEKSHRNILCTIQGLPIRCPTTGLLATMGPQTITDMITTKKLLFIHSVISLPQDSLPHQRDCECKAPKPTMLTSSDTLNLPSPNDQLQQAPSKPAWKRVVTGIIRARAEMSLLGEAERKCNLHLLTQMNWQPGSPSPLLTCTHSKDLTVKSNFRLRLLLGCHGLESDAACFQVRKGSLDVDSSTCRLCLQGNEDPTHMLRP